MLINYYQISRQMRLPHILFLLLLVTLTACGRTEKEIQLEERARALQAKGQQLAELEQQLKLKEEDLRNRERKVDSTNQIFDSLGTYNHYIIGSWTVTMNCIETDCPGSAIGDTKTEQWEIGYEGSDVIAKAFANKKLVRVY